MTESNPFQTPESDVAPDQFKNQTSDLNKNINYQAVPMLNGASWVIDGFKNFAASPFNWVLVVFVYLAILGTLSMLPFVSIISSIIAPIFMAGLMLCAKENKNHQTFQIKHLFEGFSLNGGKLAGLGALNLGVIVLLFIVIGIAVLVIFLGNIEELETMFDANLFTKNDALLIILIFLIAIAFMLPVTMAFWFAPALIIFHDVDIFAALKLSFMGCLKNMMPYLIYSIFYLVIYFIAVIPIIVMATFMDDGEPNVLLIASIVIIVVVEAFVFASVFFTSIYASYEDIFVIEN